MLRLEDRFDVFVVAHVAKEMCPFVGVFLGLKCKLYGINKLVFPLVERGGGSLRAVKCKTMLFTKMTQLCQGRCCDYLLIQSL